MSLRAIISTEKMPVTSRQYSEGKSNKVYTDYFVNISSNNAKMEFKVYLEEFQGFAIGSDISPDDDFTKAFIPEIISITKHFTLVEKLEKGVTRELGRYKNSDAEALVEKYKYSDDQIMVTIEGKNLAGINALWNMIREGNILPYKPQVKTAMSPAVNTQELAHTVNELRKKLDWALDEIARADRVIQHSNTMTAEWDRLMRERESIIAELKAKV